MIPVWNKNIEVKHISKSAEEINSYIHKRRHGDEKSLRTRWRKFNDVCMGGIEPNALYTIAGCSGSGKSAMLTTMQADLFDLNKDQEFIMLSFTFEMAGSRNAGRLISYKTKKTTSELYSGKMGFFLDDSSAEQAKLAKEEISQYDIYYVEKQCSIEEIRQAIEYFQATIAKDKWLIVTIDHTLLIRRTGGQDERIMLVELEKILIDLKKVGKTTIIQLQQMNRDIQAIDRLTNPSFHFPQRSDISSSDSVWHASDYVIVIHRPETLNILLYGPGKYPTKGFVYIHVLKNRDGETKTLQFVSNLQFSSIDEVDKIYLTNPT
jgi:replicative DNA helicase